MTCLVSDTWKNGKRKIVTYLDMLKILRDVSEYQNHKIIIGIGGNLKSNDGAHPIKVAMKAIRYFNDYSIKVTDQSSWYETEPIPKSEQPNFFNCIDCL